MSHGRFDNPVVAALAGFWDLFRKQANADKLSDNDRFDGKTCIVTGATSGLGFAVAVEMAKRGGRVIMACRSQIPEAGEKVQKLSGSTTVEMRYLDLSKIDTIHAFVEGLVKDDIRADIMVFNAGVALPKARKTESGQDEMFLVNYLSNVILTNLLIRSDRFSKEQTIPRLIFISSDSHQGSSAIDYSEFGRFYDHGVSKGIANYSYFKLILNTYATELSRKVNPDPSRIHIGVLVMCPGPVHSNIIKEAPFVLRVMLGSIFKVIFRSPAKAALPVIYMALSEDFEGKTNEYLHMFNNKRMDEKVYSPEEGSKLWKESMKVWQEIDPQGFKPVL